MKRPQTKTKKRICTYKGQRMRLRNAAASSFVNQLPNQIDNVSTNPKNLHELITFSFNKHPHL